MHIRAQMFLGFEVIRLDLSLIWNRLRSNRSKNRTILLNLYQLFFLRPCFLILSDHATNILMIRFRQEFIAKSIHDIFRGLIELPSYINKGVTSVCRVTISSVISRFGIACLIVTRWCASFSFTKANHASFIRKYSGR